MSVTREMTSKGLWVKSNIKARKPAQCITLWAWQGGRGTARTLRASEGLDGWGALGFRDFSPGLSFATLLFFPIFFLLNLPEIKLTPIKIVLIFFSV